MKKYFKLFTVILITIALLVACGGGGGGGGSADDDFTFVVALNGDPNNFHPDAKSDDYAWPINQNLFNRLVKLGPNDNVLPDLAKTWEFSDDGLELTFHMHEGVKWHDGEDLTADDVVWTYETMLEESWRSSASLGAVDSIVAEDDHTVVFHLEYPDAAIVSVLSWYGTFIMPKHLYDGTDQGTNPHNQKPVGSGPFKFVDWDKGTSVTLERNDDFFGDTPYIKTLIFSIIPDQNTAYQAFLKGEIDHLGGAVPSANVGELADDDDYLLHHALGINRTYVTFNFADDIVGDVKVREAIAYAIDQQSIFDRTGGAGEKAVNLLSPVFEDFVDTQYALPETDLAKAEELLEEAGYTKGSDGYYFKLTLTFFESGNWADVVSIIKANLDKVGIKVDIEAMEMAAWQTKVLENQDYQMTMLAGYQGPDVSAISGRIRSTGSTNVAGYNNPELDKLLADGAAETDLAKRQEIYSEVQRIMLEDLPLVLLIDNGYEYAFKKEFIGYPTLEKDRAASAEYTYVQKAK